MKEFKKDFIAFATASHSLKPHYNNSINIIDALHSENYIDYMEWIRDSSILTLLNSQGIPEHVFYQYITSESKKSNKFLDTLYNELANGYNYEAVTFFTKMTIDIIKEGNVL